MPRLRHDPISAAMVIVAPERATRPHTFRHDSPPLPASDARCPFCTGNESETPPEVFRLGSGAPNTPGWTLRITPNKYPIVEAAPAGAAATGGGDRPTGAHEVVIFSPAHDRPLGALGPEPTATVLRAVRDRVAHHLRAGRAFAQAFVNHGAAAGASIEHPHGQIVALDFVPPGTRAEVDRFGAAGRDLVADDLATARSLGSVVIDTDVAAAWCPPASGWPFESLVARPGAGARFDEADDAEIEAVAHATHEVLARLGAALGDVPYNLVLHSAPPDHAGPYHWHARITPRLVVRAGFESATAVLVNVVPPEVAAATLRDALP